MWRKLLCRQDPKSQKGALRKLGAHPTQRASIECVLRDRYCGGYTVEDRVSISVRTLCVASYRKLASNSIRNSFGSCKWRFRGRADFIGPSGSHALFKTNPMLKEMSCTDWFRNLGLSQLPWQSAQDHQWAKKTSLFSWDGVGSSFPKSNRPESKYLSEN